MALVASTGAVLSVLQTRGESRATTIREVKEMKVSSEIFGEINAETKIW